MIEIEFKTNSELLTIIKNLINTNQMKNTHALLTDNTLILFDLYNECDTSLNNLLKIIAKYCDNSFYKIIDIVNGEFSELVNWDYIFEGINESLLMSNCENIDLWDFDDFKEWIL